MASTSTSRPAAWWRRRCHRRRQEHPHALLTRLVDPDSGTVRIDGVDVRELTHAALTDAVAVAPQTTFLFDDSVRENVTLGEAVPDADIWAALRIVQAEGFVSALPQGPRHAARRARHHALRRSAPAARAGACARPAASAARHGRRHQRRRPRGRAAHPRRHSPPTRPMRDGPIGGRRRVPQGHHRLGRRGRLPRRRQGGRSRHPRRADRALRRLPTARRRLRHSREGGDRAE